MEELVRRTWYADGDPNISRRLAAIDVLEGLARATHAMTAELNGEVLGVILGFGPFRKDAMASIAVSVAAD